MSQTRQCCDSIVIHHGAFTGTNITDGDILVPCIICFRPTRKWHAIEYEHQYGTLLLSVASVVELELYKPAFDDKLQRTVVDLGLSWN